MESEQLPVSDLHLKGIVDILAGGRHQYRVVAVVHTEVHFAVVVEEGKFRCTNTWWIN